MNSIKTKTDRGLGSPKSAGELLDIYFLDIRCALLETAAAFDRMERAGNWEQVKADPRVKKLIEACDLIKEPGGTRAEQFLTLFSDPVDPM